ncbi:hypothetical protein [Rhizomicrobium electricum]|jgi:hypothetical protein|uniref:Uncharacterized protein n=1 Tax=Rhizomicrobium electricum TaxID=480070 RepID=A0ABN1END3_9PROT|nr:hypothetical protein [Rhizomicrobium electricum]NIJ46900.1 hypothetical protein [Rhizomicrobium electricum]
MGFLEWFLIGWVAISVMATPIVARLVANRVGEPEPDESLAPEWSQIAHD